MSIRARLKRLEQAVFGAKDAEPVVMLFELFGDDDHGGGWRDREPGDHGDLRMDGVDGQPVVVRPVVFAGTE